MTIGAAAVRCGVPPNTVRFYEALGLLPMTPRQANGHRTYGETELRMLQFIKCARSVGFSVDDVRTLLGLWRDRRQSGTAVKAVATGYLAALDRKMAEAAVLRQMLAELVGRCGGEGQRSPQIVDGPADGASK